jgi:hypothetical protein
VVILIVKVQRNYRLWADPGLALTLDDAGKKAAEGLAWLPSACASPIGNHWITSHPCKEILASVSQRNYFRKVLNSWANLHVTKWGQGSERHKDCSVAHCSQRRAEVADVFPATQCWWLHHGAVAHQGMACFSPGPQDHHSGRQFLWATGCEHSRKVCCFNQFCFSVAIWNWFFYFFKTDFLINDSMNKVYVCMHWVPGFFQALSNFSFILYLWSFGLLISY